MKRKGVIIFPGIAIILLVLFLSGPRIDNPDYSPDLPAAVSSPVQAEQILMSIDAEAGQIRPGNESRIVWANDSLKEKTPYCLLSLHGYSASPEEGHPVHFNFARHYGMNALMPRLAEHGLVTDEPLLNMTPDRLWESAKQALVLARAMGEKTILMGTSTGGTLALMLAAEFPEDIAAIYLYSPNIRIYNKAASILTYPWGVQIGRLITGGKYRILEEDSLTDPYWYRIQRVEGPAYLQKLIETSMNKELFSRITMPTFVGYYYKDEDNQDNTVSVDAILWMYENLGTPEEFKRKMAFPDAGHHVIPCHLTSGSWQEVQKASIEFADEILKLTVE